MLDYTATYTDQYELTMAEVYFQSGVGNKRAIFDYFFRKLPYKGGYAVFSGVEDLLTILEKLRFDNRDLEYLRRQGFDEDFLTYLESFRFTGTLYSCREGEIVFPVEPIVIVEAPIIEAQIVETLLLNILNFQTLIATKAARMRHEAGDRVLVDFGLRRAQGAGGYYATRAAVTGGFDATSNVRAGRDFQIPIAGTMAHSLIQSYDSELQAFRDFAAYRPNDCVLLVDTYDTIKSGLPNAIIVGREMKERGESLKGIRLDSGDLAWLAKKARRMLDDAGLDEVKITASNQLDETVIRSLIDQGAPIDIFGVGTRLVTGHPDGALDGVYKLAYANDKPRIKLSENVQKINLPGKKQVLRMTDEDETFFGADVIIKNEEEDAALMHHPTVSGKSLEIGNLKKEPLLNCVMESGSRLEKPLNLAEIAGYNRRRMERLPEEYKRMVNPHQYKIGLSSDLKSERDQLVEQLKMAPKEDPVG